MSGSNQTYGNLMRAKLDCPNGRKHNDSKHTFRDDRQLLSMLQTWEQTKCPGCNLYVIWVKRESKLTKLEVAEMLRCGNETALEFLAHV